MLSVCCVAVPMPRIMNNIISGHVRASATWTTDLPFKGTFGHAGNAAQNQRHRLPAIVQRRERQHTAHVVPTAGRSIPLHRLHLFAGIVAQRRNGCEVVTQIDRVCVQRDLKKVAFFI